MAIVPSSLLAEKRTLRLAMRERRKAMPAAERARCSHEATARLLALPELAGTATVAGFSALSEEIDPAAALAELRRRGAVVALPRVHSAAPRLRFHLAADAIDLRPGPFGILEPDPQAPQIAAEAIDVFLVPGIAFDPHGRRLGFGGGYYDELAPAVRRGGRGLLIGVGFDFQLVELCPASETDAILDGVVTDARVVRVEGVR
jgi:5-formyltetrahydrofolate cyclo-ligase